MESESYAFGSFQLIPGQRLLLDNGRTLPLGGRALDILTVLVEAAGETVSNLQIMARAWPTTLVEEGSLRVHIGALRKALGDGRAGARFIANNPGRGYAFVAPVRREQAPPPASLPVGAANSSSLPVPLVSIVGRAETIARLAAQLGRRRLLTIVGPGGIGKTTVAMAVAGRGSPLLSPTAYGSSRSAPLPALNWCPAPSRAALGVAPAGDPLPGVTAWLRDKQVLIVLDNCEHVDRGGGRAGRGAAAARAARRRAGDQPRAAARRGRVRLPRASRWRSRRGRPASRPPTALAAAVQLFVSARAAAGRCVLARPTPRAGDRRRSAGGSTACRWRSSWRRPGRHARDCRGSPARLDDRFTLLTGGHRTALRAAADAAGDAGLELRAAAADRADGAAPAGRFRGGFTWRRRARSRRRADLRRVEVVDSVANLVDEVARGDGCQRRSSPTRLLETTRAYALEKLPKSGEHRTAWDGATPNTIRDLFERAEGERESRPQAEWLAAYGRQIDNVRAGAGLGVLRATAIRGSAWR